MPLWFYVLGWFPSTVAVLGNVLVVFIIAVRPRLRNQPNWFVLSLALADFAVGLIYFPTYFFCRKLGLCKTTIAHDIAFLAMFASVTSLCAMAFDRYIAIMKPFKYVTWMTRRRAALLIALAWCVPLTLGFIPVLCSWLGKCNLQNKTLMFSKIVVFVVLPCLFLLITTAQIIITARRHWRQDAHLDSQLQYNQPNHRRAKDFSTAKVIIVVVMIFLACYSVELYDSVHFIIYSSSPTEEVEKVISLLIVVNSAANPIAYALFKRDIRKELQKTLCRKTGVVLRQHDSASSRTTTV